MPQPASAARWLMRAVALLLVAVAGLTLAAPAVSAAPHPAAAVSTQNDLDGVAITCPSGQENLGGVCVDRATSGALKGDQFDPAGLLPAYRWSDSTDLWGDESGMFGFVANFANAIVSALFAIASLIWSALLFFLRLGSTTNFVDAMASTINAGVLAIFKTIAPLTAVIILIAAIRVVRAGGRSSRQSVLRVALTFLLFTGGMLAIAQRTDNYVANGGSDAWTMPWIAAQVDRLTSEPVAAAVQAISGIGSSDPTFVAKSGQPDCESYIREIYQSYQDQAGKDYSPMLVTMSQLWEKSYLASWQKAQLGTAGFKYDPGSRIYCHLLDSKARIPTSEQARLAKLAYPQIAAAQPSAFGTPADSEDPLFGPFFESGGFEKTRKAAVLWAACDWNPDTNSWTPAGGFRMFVGEDEVFTPTDCADSFAGVVNERFNYYGDRAETALNGAKKSPEAELANVQTLLEAMNGGNFVARIITGFMTIGTAGAYLFVLGAVALGQVLTQVGLILLLIAAPLSLLLAGLGARVGMRMLRLTGAAMVSHALFGVLIGFIITMTSLITNLVVTTSTGVVAAGVAGAVPGVLALGPVMANADNYDYSIGSGNGLFQQIVFAAAPIISLIAVRFILKAAGLADITKFTSALGFMTAAVARTSGDKEMIAKTRTDANGNSALTRKIGNVGYNRKVPMKDKKGNVVTGKNGKPVMTKKRVGLGNLDQHNLAGVGFAAATKGTYAAGAAGAKIGGGLLVKGAYKALKDGDQIKRDRQLARGVDPADVRGSRSLAVADWGKRRIESAGRRRADLASTLDTYRKAGLAVETGQTGTLSDKAIRWGEFRNALGTALDDPLGTVVRPGALAVATGSLAAPAAQKIGVAIRGRIPALAAAQANVSLEDIDLAGGRLNVTLPNSALRVEVPPVTLEGGPLKLTPASGTLTAVQHPLKVALNTAGVAGDERTEYAVAAATAALEAHHALSAPEPLALLNAQSRLLAGNDLAQRMGLGASSILVDSAGAYAVLAAPIGRDGKRDLTGIHDPRALSRPGLFLDVPKEAGMSDDEYVARKQAWMLAHGLIDVESGREVDMVKMVAGYDVANPVDARKVAEWFHGERSDARLDRLLDPSLISRLRPDEEVLAAALTAADLHVTATREVQLAQRVASAVVAVETLDSAQEATRTLITGDGQTAAALDATAAGMEQVKDLMLEVVARMDAQGLPREDRMTDPEYQQGRQMVEMLGTQLRQELEFLVSNIEAIRLTAEINSGEESPIDLQEYEARLESTIRAQEQLAAQWTAAMASGNPAAMEHAARVIADTIAREKDAGADMLRRAEELLEALKGEVADTPETAEYVRSTFTGDGTMSAADIRNMFGMQPEGASD